VTGSERLPSSSIRGTLERYRSEALSTYPRLPQFLAIARLNRPIGIYLLLWPTLWGLWFAAEGWPGWHLFLIFTGGTVLTRSAGCVINDIADRKFDGHVERTNERPLATGSVAIEEAVIFLFALLFAALVLVLSTNLATVVLAFCAAAIAAVYPFMKRYTYLPQVILGIAFSFGIPMAFTAYQDDIPRVAFVLMIANILWTVAYDTEYAMVDRDDDIRLGLKSSAILFADMDKLIIGILQLTFLGTMVLVGRQMDATNLYYGGLIAAAGFLTYQQYLIRNRERNGCFAAFLNNHWVGLCIFAGIAGSYLSTG
jgi:4-hydroxybenzoate polyprenyltransferase